MLVGVLQGYWYVINPAHLLGILTRYELPTADDDALQAVRELAALEFRSLWTVAEANRYSAPIAVARTAVSGANEREWRS